MLTIDRIRNRLAALAPQTLEIEDQSTAHIGHPGAGGGHYHLLIVTESFREQSTLNRHRIIYQILAEMLQRDIHALSIKAYTPDEFQQHMAKQCNNR